MNKNFIKNFCDKIKKKFKKNVLELHEPLFINKEKQFLSNAIIKKIVSTHGNYTEKFEKKLSTFTKIKYSVATNSGTSAIHLSLIALGLNKNDEVFMKFKLYSFS